MIQADFTPDSEIDNMSFSVISLLFVSIRGNRQELIPVCLASLNSYTYTVFNHHF